MENMTARPLALKWTDAKNKIIGAVNEANQVSGIPCFLLEELLADILRQVKECAKQERAEAARRYEQEIKKNRQREDET